MPEVDYDKIARQHGGKVVEDVDYDALAAQFGGKVVQPELGWDPPTATPDKRAFTQEDFNRHMLPDPKVVAAAAPIAAGIALGPMVGALPIRGALGAVGRWAAANPAGAGAISGAIPGVLRGDLREAAIGAGAGAVGIPAIGGAAGAATALARKVLGPAARAAPRAAKAIKATTKAAAPAAKAVTEAAPAAAKAVDRGKAVAAKHAATVAFAKDIAARNPKVGEKIWLLLDKQGNPTKWITPDQAGAAARRGEATTWIRNLWR